MQSVYSALATVLAYLLGSLSFGVLMSRAFGLPGLRGRSVRYVGTVEKALATAKAKQPA